MHPFNINRIDHVAVRVKDLKTSISWYEIALGCVAVEKPEWGKVPIMMNGNNICVALFPSRSNDAENELLRKSVDHFALNLSNEEWKKACSFYDSIALHYVFQDHTYFHSIYLKDPDNHIVELTTLVKDDPDFGPVQ